MHQGVDGVKLMRVFWLSLCVLPQQCRESKAAVSEELDERRKCGSNDKSKVKRNDTMFSTSRMFHDPRKFNQQPKYLSPGPKFLGGALAAEETSKNAIKRLKKAELIAAKKKEKQLASSSKQHSAADEQEFTWEGWAEEGGAALSFIGHDLRGGDKYLGGELGDDGNIYGVPGSAKCVIKVHVETQQVSEMGHNLKGPYIETTYPKNQFKWLRGARGRDGAIYGVPSNANKVLRITPQTGVCEAIGGPWVGHWKWHGGVMGPDGNIYGIPCNAEQVLKIDTVTGECSLFGGPYPGQLKWYGGLLGCDGCIYAIANCAEQVLKIDPVRQTTELIGQLPPDKYKWHGGAIGSDKCIYGFPSHFGRVLKIDPRTGFCAPIGEHIHVTHRGGRYKYGGGVLGKDGFIYCFPSDAERVLQIRCPIPTPSTLSLHAPSTRTCVLWVCAHVFACVFECVCACVCVCVCVHVCVHVCTQEVKQMISSRRISR
jgi:hypothetical protein